MVKLKKEISVIVTRFGNNNYEIYEPIENTHKNQILNYFEILIKKRQSKENKDIINFKKALFLIKNSEVKKGNELLNEMIKNNSNLKFLAEEVILK